MEFAIFAFLAVFLLIASGGLLLFYREVMLKRISEVIHPRPKEKSIGSVVEHAKSSIGSLMESVENLMPKSDKEVSIVVQRLTRAGYRNESAVKIFYGYKLVTPLVLCGSRTTVGFGKPGSVFCVPDDAGRRVSGAGLLAGEEDRRSGKRKSTADCPMCWICW